MGTSSVIWCGRSAPASAATWRATRFSWLRGWYASDQAAAMSAMVPRRGLFFLRLGRAWRSGGAGRRLLWGRLSFGGGLSHLASRRRICGTSFACGDLMETVLLEGA